jgi:hypothetical protein
MLGLIVALIIVITVASAFAHDTWADGLLIPPWVKSACCGPEDVHRDPTVYQDDDGNWYVDDLARPVEKFRIYPSQDGHIWAFYDTRSVGKEYAIVYCLFIPMNF